MHLSDKVLIFCFLAAGTSGCSPELANPLLNNDMTYMAKPVVSDSLQWGTYVSGNLGLSDGFNEDDANHFWELNAHQSYTSKSASIALGAFGYSGKYTLNTDSLQNFPVIRPFFGSYAYYGGGLRGSINFTLPTNRVDVRFIGVDAAWNKEWGNYLTLRKTVHPLPDVMAITDDELISVALTSEVCIKLRPESQLAIKVYLGHIHKGQLENYESFGANFLVANVYYTYRPLFVTAQINAFENAGGKIGFGYRLH